MKDTLKNSLIKNLLEKSILICSLIALLVGISGNTVANARFLITQEGPARGIALACAAALEGIARNPDADEVILEELSGAVSAIKALRTRVSRGEVGEASGIIAAALIANVARQPSAQEELEDLASDCIADLRSLL
jgi:F0F1-type ATP synthase membrane subunit c/vacuolar-type H+-ATPase subunit K